MTLPSETISVSGHLCVDYIITVEEYPPIGESRSRNAGYTSAGVRRCRYRQTRWSGRAHLCGRESNFPGSEYERYLQELGVKTTFRSEKNSSTAFMVNNATGDQVPTSQTEQESSLPLYQFQRSSQMRHAGFWSLVVAGINGFIPLVMF